MHVFGIWLGIMSVVGVLLWWYRNERSKQRMFDYTTRKRRICIIGAGAAGMACAWSLSRFPERFDIEVWEKDSHTGGVATSVELENGLFINDGVQGGSPSYHNTLLLLQEIGFRTFPVNMTVSFGKGPTAWNNYLEQEAPLIQRLQSEIERFGRVLRWIFRLELLFVFIPIDTVLWLWGFSSDFRNHLVFPLTALFFGTGNQTPRVSAAIFARVFLDEQLRLFDYDSKRFLNQRPLMFTFPKLADVYHKLAALLESRKVRIFLNRAVKRVMRVESEPGKRVVVTDANNQTTSFDDVVFACSAEVVLRVLEDPTRIERFALSNVRYYDDITVTHEDLDYMQKHYEVNLGDQYYIKTYATHPEKVEMSFNLTKYQSQLKNSERNIFQTIFLDAQNEKSLWTISEISSEKILLKKWWRQFAHTWSHFAGFVPFVRFLQGSKNNTTWYAGSHTLVNTHEIAIISGLAVAFRLGASYPFTEDQLAKKQFRDFLAIAHARTV